MAEVERIEVIRIERNTCRWYRILAAEQNWRSVLDMHLSPGELLELVAYAEENRTQLEQEAEEDEKRNARLVGRWERYGTNQTRMARVPHRRRRDTGGNMSDQDDMSRALAGVRS